MQTRKMTRQAMSTWNPVTCVKDSFFILEKYATDSKINFPLLVHSGDCWLFEIVTSFLTFFKIKNSTWMTKNGFGLVTLSFQTLCRYCVQKVCSIFHLFLVFVVRKLRKYLVKMGIKSQRKHSLFVVTGGRALTPPVLPHRWRIQTFHLILARNLVYL